MTESTDRYEFPDVTVVIPYREDTSDRRRNLEYVLRFFQRYCNWNQVLIVEQACRPTTLELADGNDFITHVACRSDAVFHKSRLLNLGIAYSESKFVLVYDADVLFDPDAFREALRLLRAAQFDFVFPYNHAMLQIKQETLERGIDLDADFVASLPVCRPGERPDDPRCERLYGEPGDPCAGGALMFNRRVMLLHGGYNENIISYSCEDVELLSRLQILGAKLACLDNYCCYHLPHRRGEDSRYNNFHAANLAEWDSVRNMGQDDLWRYVFNGFRCIVLEPGVRYKFANEALGYELSVCREDGRTDLSDLSLVLYIDKQAPFDLERVRAGLRKLDESFTNYEVFLLEGNGDQFRRIHHTQYMFYQRLAKEQVPFWEQIGSKYSSRPIVICADLRSTDLEQLYELLTVHWKYQRKDDAIPLTDGLTIMNRSKTGTPATR